MQGSHIYSHTRSMVIAFFLCVALPGCSLKDRSKYLGTPPSAPTAIVVNNEAPKTGDTLSVSATGGSDPEGLGAVQYRVEWFLDGAPDFAHRDTVGEGEESTLPVGLLKGQEWTIVVTSLATDGRVGLPAQTSVTVINSPPSLTSAALSSYQPFADDVVRAVPLGFSDPDLADVTKEYRYRWVVNSDTSAEASVDTGAIAQVDLENSAFALPSDPEADNHTLTLQVFPFDGDEEGEALSLGPFPILNDTTRWTRLWPNTILRQRDAPEGDASELLGSFVLFDEKNERFVIKSADSLWEYTETFGFVELHPTGVAPKYARFQVVYDPREGFERAIVLTGELGEPYELYSLSLSERGNEVWKQLDDPLPGVGDDPLNFRCYPNIFFDPFSTIPRLFITGGLPNCDLHAASDENTYIVVLLGDGQLWQRLEETKIGHKNGIFGSTTVYDPNGRYVYLVGGYRNSDSSPANAPSWVPASSQRITIRDADGNTTNSASNIQSSGSGWGQVAFFDESTGRVVSGFGLDTSLDSGLWAPTNVDRIWSIDAENRNDFVDTAAPAGSLQNSNWIFDRVDAQGLDGGLGRGALGVTGVLGGKRVVWPGYGSKDGANLFSTFHLLEVDGDTSVATNWSLYKRFGGELPGLVGPATTVADGGLVAGDAHSDNGSILVAWGGPDDEARPLGLNRLGRGAVDGESIGMPAGMPTGKVVAIEDGIGFVLTPYDGSDPWIYDGSGWAKLQFGEFSSTGQVVAATRCGATPTLITRSGNDLFHVSCSSPSGGCESQPMQPVFVEGPPIEIAFDANNQAIAVAPIMDDVLGIWRADLCGNSTVFAQQSHTGVLPPLVNPFTSPLLSYARRVSKDSGETRIAFFDGYSDSNETKVFLMNESSGLPYDISEVNAGGVVPPPLYFAATAWDEANNELLLLSGITANEESLASTIQMVFDSPTGDFSHTTAAYALRLRD